MIPFKNHKFFFWLVLSAFTLLLLAIVLISYIYLSTYNSKSGTQQFSGLKGRVTITTDRHGIPSIEAHDDDHDAFFALGFVHAQDRFWQMELQRRIVTGTLSEIFGKETIEKDKYLRTWGFYQAAIIAWESLDNTTQSFVKSYTAGVNAFLKSGHLPLEVKLLRYQPSTWTNIDSIAWQKMMAWNLQNSWQKKLINQTIAKQFGAEYISVFQPPYPMNGPVVLSKNEYPPSLLTQRSSTLSSISKHTVIIDNLKTAKLIRKDLGFADIAGKGSNAWVISGKFTQSGKPILANDPHLQLSAPVIWYLAKLKGPTLHVTGATIPGLPFVIIGHNDHIAWGVTDAAIDAQDLYIESSKTKVVTHQEQINVKNDKLIIINVKSSDHGPFIENNLALKWPALMPGDTSMQSLRLVNYASNWQSFKNALKWQVAPALNFIYADDSGNIGYHLAGKIPKRLTNNPLPISSNDQREWHGYIPFEQLPSSYNPEKGYFVSANNKIIADDYIYPLTFRWSTNPYRAQRIIDLIEQSKPISVSSVQTLQNDTMSYLWLDIKDSLLITDPLNEESRFALKKLKAWNGHITLKDTAPTIFAYWYKELATMTPQELIATIDEPEISFIKTQLKTDGIYCRTATTKNCAEFLSQSLKKAVLQMKNNKKQWGQLHRAQFKATAFGDITLLGRIWNRHIATAGGDDTVNVGTYDIKTFEQTDGPGYRQVIDFGNLSNSHYIIALGQSGNILNKHYDDQLALWGQGSYLLINSDSTKQNLKTLVLEPEDKYACSRTTN